MPEICRFYGIVIRMYHADHAPPHIHCEYASQQMVLDLRTLAVITGRLSPRATGLIVEWASQHRQELLELWDKAQRHEPLTKIEPLP